MWRRGILVSVIGLVLLCWVANPGPLCAASPHYAEDLPLVPLGAPGFVQLTSCTLLAELSCDGPRCNLRVQQNYRFHNRDRIQEAPLRLGLGVAQSEAGPPPPITLQEVEGAALRPSGSDAQHRAIWELNFGRNESKTLVLTHTHAIPPGHLVHWRWEMSLLAAWGTIEGARVEFRQPGYITDDALLVVEPRSFSLDGQRILWEYENPQPPLQHELVMISPDTWQQMNGFRATGAHYELARLLQEIQGESQDQRVPFPDPFHEIVAEFAAALQADPGNVPARMDLAQVYRSRADALPDLRLNYLLLAAQELELALKQRPGDTQIASVLRRTYSDAATVASEADDPSSALAYLKQAQETPGTPSAQEQRQQEILSMRWALRLAEQGLVSRSWAQIEGSLSAPVKDTLLLHAPSVVSAQTEVELRPGSRLVRYRFNLYPPSASRTLARLQEVIVRLNGLDGCQATLETETNLATLMLQVAYPSVSALQERSVAVRQALPTDQDLLSATIAIPWELERLTYGVERELWRDLYIYRESVDLAPLQAIWEQEAEYTRWRTVELSAATPGDERSQLEQRLALQALYEQGRIWERLPSGSYWVFRTTFTDALQPPPDPKWLLAWGQARELEAIYPVWHSSLAILLIPLAVTIAVLWGAVAVLRRRR